MIYKGYTAEYEIDPDDGVFHGQVVGIEDIITFESDNLENLEREFRISVDDYLEWCAEDGVEPNRPRPAETP